MRFDTSSADFEIPMSNPLAKLLQVASLLRERDPELAGWFAPAVDAYLAGETRTLDGALGITGRGLDSPARRLARERRDAAIRRALGHLGPLRGETPKARRRRLIQALGAFETRVLPRLRSGAREPKNDLEEALLAVFEAGAGPPRHERSLQRILAATSDVVF